MQNQQELHVEIDVMVNTKGEKTYKFLLEFIDGRTASSIRIMDVGKKFTDYPCFMGNSIKNTPDFLMKIEPDNLFNKNDTEIKKIILMTKLGKGHREAVFQRIE